MSNDETRKAKLEKRKAKLEKRKAKSGDVRLTLRVDRVSIVGFRVSFLQVEDLVVAELAVIDLLSLRRDGLSRAPRGVLASSLSLRVADGTRRHGCPSVNLRASQRFVGPRRRRVRTLRGSAMRGQCRLRPFI